MFSYQDIIAFTKLEKTTEEEDSVFSFFLQRTCSYKVRKDLQVNSKAFECLCVEVENKKSKNIIPKLVYLPPNGDHKELESYFKTSLSERNISNKDITK